MSKELGLSIMIIGGFFAMLLGIWLGERVGQKR